MAKPTDAELENRHGYHPPKTPAVADAHEAIRAQLLHTAKRVRDICPAGRELAVALTKLDEARMWANAAIACNPPEKPTDE